MSMIEKSFKNDDLGIEIVSYFDKNQNIFFIGKDVAKILGYRDTNQAIRKHVDDEDKKYFPVETTAYLKRGRPPIIINESGFYSLVLSSKLKTAKKFKRWVTSEVLPSIRKYGFYKMFDLRIKQRVIFDGKKIYKHPVFNDYAASKNGNILSLKTKKILKMNKERNGYLKFVIYNKKIEKPLNYKQHRFVYEVFKGAIPSCLEIDHRNNLKNDNRIRNLHLLTRKQNNEKSHNKSIISISIETGEKRRFDSIKKASIELDINKATISNICCQRKYRKTATSKKDGNKYSFLYED